MNIELKERVKFENRKLVKTGERYYIVTPDEGKAIMNKITKKVFVHTKKHEGLPLTINLNDLGLYEEVTI